VIKVSPVLFIYYSSIFSFLHIKVVLLKWML